MKIRNIAFSGFMASILMAGAAYADTVLATKSYVDSGVDYALQHAKDYVDDSTYITKADGTNAGEYSLNAKIATFKTDGSVNADGLVTGSQLAAANADTAELKETVAGHTTDISNLKAKDTELAGSISANTTAIETNTAAIGTNTSNIAGLTTRVTTAEGDIDALETGKQDALTTTQMAAVNSGITSAKVATYDGYADTIADKANSADVYTKSETYTKTEVDTELAKKQDKVLGTYSKATAASAIGTTDTVSGALGKLEYKVDTKANSADVYTKSETYTRTEADAAFMDSTEVNSAITTAIANKADKATTLAGYGITDAYTQAEVDTALNGKQNTLTGQNGVVITNDNEVGLDSSAYTGTTAAFWGYNGSTWSMVNVTGDTYPGN